MAANRKLLAALITGFIAIAPSVHAQSALMAYCKPDVERLCPGVQMGGGRIIKCLKAHQNEMTVGCAKALRKLKGRMG
jgi:Cysteine rich repeat